jgi:hypothetical protein
MNNNCNVEVEIKLRNVQQYKHVRVVRAYLLVKIKKRKKTLDDWSSRAAKRDD